MHTLTTGVEQSFPKEWGKTGHFEMFVTEVLVPVVPANCQGDTKIFNLKLKLEKLSV